MAPHDQMPCGPDTRVVVPSKNPVIPSNSSHLARELEGLWIFRIQLRRQFKHIDHVEEHRRQLEVQFIFPESQKTFRTPVSFLEELNLELEGISKC